jgi:hypothetical protein
LRAIKASLAGLNHDLHLCAWIHSNQAKVSIFSLYE